MSHSYTWKKWGYLCRVIWRCLLCWRIFCSSPQRCQAEILTSKIRVRGVAFGRCFNHENRILRDVIRRDHRHLIIPFPTGVTGQSSVTSSLCQELNLLAPWFALSIFQNCTEHISVLHVPGNLQYSSHSHRLRAHMASSRTNLKWACLVH